MAISKLILNGVTQMDVTGLTAASGNTQSGFTGIGNDGINFNGSIGSGSVGTPIATKGTVSNHSVSVTPSVTHTAGIIDGGTKTGTAVTVSASELVSGSETKTANGTYDVTNLAELVVNVASGGGGWVTESGTVSLTANTNTISVTFANTHSTSPVFVALADTSAASSDITSNTNLTFCYVDYYKLFGSGYPSSTSATRYSTAYYTYRGSSNTSNSGVNTQYSSDNTGTSSTSYSRYWASSSGFKAYTNSTSRYWKSGRTYKWVAVWMPTT